MQAGVTAPAASDASPQGMDHSSGPRIMSSEADGSDPMGSWLKVTFDKIILEQRPRVPGWGLLRPQQMVGEYMAEDGYLLLVFDHRGRPHTRRFTPAEVTRLRVDTARGTAQLKSLIQAFCADA